MDARLLKEIGFFREVDETTLSAIAGPSFFQSFPSNVVLARQNRSPDFLYVLTDGLVEVRTELEDRQHTLAIIEPVAALLAEAVLTEEVCLAEHRTISASQLVMIPAPIVRTALNEDPAFCRAMLMQVSQTSRSYVRQLNGQKLRSGVERLAAWALDEWNRHDKASVFSMRHSKRVLANLLGMTPENLSRTLSSLEPSGLRFDGRKVEVWNPETLRKVAQPTPVIDARM